MLALVAIYLLNGNGAGKAPSGSNTWYDWAVLVVVVILVFWFFVLPRLRR